MEQKTIGTFIAALRRASGMTQKELAERLNVSDKTVSRWEREEGAPDLSLIPVIAEIFGVTCDELLRGERSSPARRAAEPEQPEPSARSEKQRRRLLQVSLSRYTTRTFIAMGVSAAGLIAAMVGNLGFLRAYVGFFIGLVFYLAGTICQAAFVNSAFLCVSEDSLSADEAGQFRWSVVRLARWSFGLTAVLLGFSLPLLIFPGSAHRGLSADSWLPLGLLFALSALALTAAACWFVTPALLRRGVCVLPPEQEPVYHHNHALKGRCAGGLATALVLTLLFHAMGSELIWSTHMLAPGTVFTDYESFVAYMEQDVPYESTVSYRDGLFTTAHETPAAPAEVPDSGLSEQEQQKKEDQARTRTLEDIKGNVVCTYVHRNENATSIRYSPQEGTVLPITVITSSDYRAARNLSQIITVAFTLIYPIEAAAAFIIYFKKRAKPV